MKTQRHAKIIELISKYSIETQEELAARLQEAGYQVTQATVSRDIRELKLTKMASEDGRQKYMVYQERDDVTNQKYVRDQDRVRDGHGGGGCAGRHALVGNCRLYRGRRHDHVRGQKRGRYPGSHGTNPQNSGKQLTKNEKANNANALRSDKKCSLVCM